jgi:SAM-dependent methyltransferase
MRSLPASWYDYPAYYDLAFRSETRAEADFIEVACRKYARGPIRTLLEPGCGSGRLIAALAARGYRLTGFDLNPAMLEYAARKLSRRGLKARLFQGDMADFRIDQPVDAAFCTFKTFRHLLSEADARGHLECVAKALRPGGIYILGLHLLPLDVAEESEERWQASHGRTKLHATLRVIHTDRRRRMERLRLSLRVRSPRRQFRMRSEFALRMYTAGQFLRLLKSVFVFELCDVFDFWYEIDRPQRLDEVRTDTVVVLRRRAGPRL